MTTGEKIKKLREEKMMTQAELVGGEITRNMLSRIENGKATPSLGTLKYLAQRLGTPVGYLISDDEGDSLYEKSFIIEEIKLAFKSGHYEICSELCRRSGLKDDEVLLIAAEAVFLLATEAFNSGKLKLACAYFDEAISHCDKTIYNTSHIVAASAMYFRYMRELSPNLYSNTIDEGLIPHYCAMDFDFCRYIYAIEGVRNGHTTFARQYVEKGKRESSVVIHLDAAIDISNRNYRLAHSKLIQALENKSEIYAPILYAVFCDLEVCCRELRDFKGAYEYSTAKIELLQKMLWEE